MARKASIIAITSGKGGVGKTSIAVNLGILFAKLGKRVCLIDGDYGLANINLLLGIPPKKQPADLFEKNFNPSKVMIKTEWGLDVLSSASGISQQQPILAPSSSQVNRLVKKLSADYDVILIDTAAGIGASVQNYLGVADQALLVINSEPTSLTDSFGLIKNMRNVQTRYNVVVNRVKDENTANEIYYRFSGAVEKYINIPVQKLGFIKEDSFASAAILSQSPLVIYSSQCRASQCFSQIISNLSSQLDAKEFDENDYDAKFLPERVDKQHIVPEKPKFIQSIEDSFENWLLQMPNLLMTANDSNDKRNLKLNKERKNKFIAELGELCLKDASILKSFENMVIEKKMDDVEFDTVIIEHQKHKQHDRHPSQASMTNLSTKQMKNHEVHHPPTITQIRMKTINPMVNWFGVTTPRYMTLRPPAMPTKNEPAIKANAR